MPNGDFRSTGRTLANFVGRPGITASEFPVRSATVRIGQGTQNEIVLDDDTVSTSHARLEYAEGEWRLTDLDSRNGTYVEGVRLTPGVPAQLSDDANVAFGAMTLRFQVEAGADPKGATGNFVSGEARKPSQRRTGFRLPVWLFLVIILILAVVVFLLVTMTGDPTPTTPVPNASPAFLRDAAEQVIAA
jgi:hypothetical protein